VNRFSRKHAALVLVLGVALVGSGSAAASANVVVPRDEPVQVAVAVPLSGPFADFGTSFVNAAQMAVELHPNVRGFPVELDAFRRQLLRDRCRRRVGDRR
jgi:hypothetical protein